MFAQSLRISVVGLLAVAVTAWASSTPVGPSIVQGDVKDSNGQPVAGAELHIRAKDGTGFYRIVHTDASGRYAVGKLPNTDYEVILFLNGSIKASINNTKTFANKPTQLDFKLTGQYAANKTAKKHTHMVYVPAETGSNLSGRWVEVDDNGDSTAAATAGTGKLERGGAAMLKQLHMNSGASGGGN